MMEEKRRTKDKKNAKNERWCSYAMDEDDFISSKMDDSFSPALGDDWKNWRVDDPGWESGESAEEGVNKLRERSDKY